jgi:hypothetical protein
MSRGHDFTVIARLGSLPEPTTEPLLAAWADSIQRLVARACNSVHERKINDFDLIRINSILYRSRPWDRPLLVDLKETTYQRYIRVWQRLVCFAYRSEQPHHAARLRHRLIRAQSTWLAQMVHHGRTLLALEQEQSATSCRPSTQPGGTSSSSSSSSTASDVHVQRKEAQGQLDQACLQFSIAILDHTIAISQNPTRLRPSTTL